MCFYIPVLCLFDQNSLYLFVKTAHLDLRDA